MAGFALSLYESGLGPGEVLRRCYGVPFPHEFLILSEPQEMNGDLLVDLFDQPWQMAVPPERGGPRTSALPRREEHERALLARDPDLLPLLVPLGVRERHGGKTIGYRLSELAVGRTTVFALPRDARPGSAIERVGHSLLALLHEHHADAHKAARDQYNAPSNRGFGMVDADEVDELAALLRHVQDLQRRTTEQPQ
ncbi:hypothetical protein [Yinghuangia soli]|uniref:Uncharacterized protein n=1 Tax=Yinghuangia soli TaxID=2908204 RepID=A0AA41U2F4_9ACTN|nr:hypothetical protein [Yinghuangia soli]MCF2527054.1 hypothetical protein [Yinghuangia soli]